MDWALSTLRAGKSLSFEQMIDVMNSIMSGQVNNAEIAELLTLLHRKGETVDELGGAAKALQQKMSVLKCDHRFLIDTCGTGGSGKNTFNISTAAALVASAAGACVAKHGNRAITGRSGSADVLQVLGVKVDASLEIIEKCLNELGICFCFAPLFHPSVKHASAARKQLDFPTIFNLLGPLCNPARAPYQLLGAGRGETRELLAAALARLGTRKSAVVHGRDGVGEITIGCETDVSLIENDEIRSEVWGSSRTTGAGTFSIVDLQVSSPNESATMINEVLDDRPGPALEIVVANSGAALWLVGIACSLEAGSEMSRVAISSGKAREKLQMLADMSNSQAS